MLWLSLSIPGNRNQIMYDVLFWVLFYHKFCKLCGNWGKVRLFAKCASLEDSKNCSFLYFAYSRTLQFWLAHFHLSQQVMGNWKKIKTRQNLPGISNMNSSLSMDFYTLFCFPFLGTNEIDEKCNEMEYFLLLTFECRLGGRKMTAYWTLWITLIAVLFLVDSFGNSKAGKNSQLKIKQPSRHHSFICPFTSKVFLQVEVCRRCYVAALMGSMYIGFALWMFNLIIVF